MADARRPRAKITHTRAIPDPRRLARYQRAPELGPRILFFSGGTALRGASHALTRYTHHSIHLITPFDSGGSSAKLRDAFPMIAVGDLRNRLMALADTELYGQPEVYRLFGTRLPETEDDASLRARLTRLIADDDPLIHDVPRPLRTLIRSQLRIFAERMPPDFDLRGASIGNLILAGGYLSNDHDIDAVVFLFSKLVAVRGFVRPVVNANLHLAAELTSGRVIVGQHRLTSRAPPIPAPIRELRLSSTLTAETPASASIDRRTRELITEAELVCFPIGSFYTSVLACLLPEGVGAAIADAGCPKVYIPNCGLDPELRGRSPVDAVAALLAQLRRDSGEATPVERLLNFVLVDSARGSYEGGLDIAGVEALGVSVLDVPLVTDDSAPLLSPQRLVEALLSLV
ncbi:MAG: GAK system CofD-like protein [Nannocystaceae bacterium]